MGICALHPHPPPQKITIDYQSVATKFFSLLQLIPCPQTRHILIQTSNSGVVLMKTMEFFEETW